MGGRRRPASRPSRRRCRLASSRVDPVMPWISPLSRSLSALRHGRPLVHDGVGRIVGRHVVVVRRAGLATTAAASTTAGGLGAGGFLVTVLVGLVAVGLIAGLVVTGVAVRLITVLLAATRGHVHAGPGGGRGARRDGSACSSSDVRRLFVLLVVVVVLVVISLELDGLRRDEKRQVVGRFSAGLAGALRGSVATRVREPSTSIRQSGHPRRIRWRALHAPGRLRPASTVECALRARPSSSASASSTRLLVVPSDLASEWTLSRSALALLVLGLF